MATKKLNLEAELANWTTCNEFLRNATEEEAQAALKWEKTHKRRLQYLLRMHARFNKVRADRERSELLSLA